MDSVASSRRPGRGVDKAEAAHVAGQHVIVNAMIHNALQGSPCQFLSSFSILDSCQSTCSITVYATKVGT